MGLYPTWASTNCKPAIRRWRRNQQKLRFNSHENYAAALLLRGRILLAQGKAEEAIEFLQRAAALDSTTRIRVDAGGCLAGDGEILKPPRRSSAA